MFRSLIHRRDLQLIRLALAFGGIAAGSFVFVRVLTGGSGQSGAEAVPSTFPEPPGPDVTPIPDTTPAPRVTALGLGLLGLLPLALLALWLITDRGWEHGISAAYIVLVIVCIGSAAIAWFFCWYTVRTPSLVLYENGLASVGGRQEWTCLYEEVVSIRNLSTRTMYMGVIPLKTRRDYGLVLRDGRQLKIGFAESIVSVIMWIAQVTQAPARRN